MGNQSHTSLRVGFVLFLLLFSMLFVGIFTYVPLISDSIRKNEQQLQQQLQTHLSQIETLLPASPPLNDQDREALKTQLLQNWQAVNLQPDISLRLIGLQSDGNFTTLLSKPNPSSAIQNQSTIKALIDLARQNQSHLDVSLSGLSIHYSLNSPLLANNWVLLVEKNFELTAMPIISSLQYSLLGMFLMLLMSLLLLRLFRKKTPLPTSQEPAQQIIANNRDWIWQLDQNQHFIYCSDEVKLITGYQPEQLLNTPFSNLLSQEDDGSKMKSWQQKLMLRETFKNFEVTLQHAKGKNIQVLLNGQPIFDAQGKIQGYLGSTRDISSLRAATSNQHEHCDPVTEIYNRAFFMNQLNKLLDSYHESHNIKPSAVLLIDLDEFKKINQKYDQNIGDKALYSIAQRLKKATGKTQLLARYSGAQFIILYRADAQITAKAFIKELEEFMEQMFDDLSVPIQIGSFAIEISCSIGVAQIPQDGKSLTEILSHADSAMQHAKERQSNTYEFFDLDTQKTINKKIKTAGELDHAIKNNELILHYQLQFNDDKVSGMEALLRWKHPESKRIISAADFMPFIDDHKQIHQIDKWVINQVASDIAKMSRIMPRTPRVSINLSNQEVFSEDLSNLIEFAMKKHFLAGNTLNIETSEDLLTADISESNKIIQNLKKLGVCTIIDHFGTGNMSLSNLQNLGVNAIKIDKSFIDNITTNHADLEMCRTIIQLAKSLKLQVIAEGVETEAQKRILNAEGCHIIQGYVYTQPAPIDKVIQLLTEHPEIQI